MLDEQPVEPTEKPDLLPVIDSPEAARALPKDGQVAVETITSVEAATALVDGFHGELLIQHIL